MKDSTDTARKARKAKPKPPPHFMRPDFTLGKEESLRENPEYWIARALLIGAYRDDPDRLVTMVEATEFSKAPDLDSWLAIAREYPEPGLTHGSKRQYDNADVPVRAFVLAQALTSLLKIIEAPAKLTHDLEILMDSFHPHLGRSRAKLQKLRLEQPDLNLEQALSLLEPYNERQAKRDQALGDVLHLKSSGDEVSPNPPKS